MKMFFFFIFIFILMPYFPYFRFSFRLYRVYMSLSICCMNMRSIELCIKYHQTEQNVSRSVYTHFVGVNFILNVYAL